DLGSTSPAILPVPAASAIRHLGLQSGKDARLRLLDLDNLSGKGRTGDTGGEVGGILRVPPGGEVLTAAAVCVNPADQTTWVFLANSAGISGLKLTQDASGTPGLQAVWKQSKGGTSPIVANGVLLYAGSHNLRALDPVTGTELGRDSTIGAIHWE